jgi:hypothetical protein
MVLITLALFSLFLFCKTRLHGFEGRSHLEEYSAKR